MRSWPLGSDVPLSFSVKVSGRQALLRDATAKIYKNDKEITEIMATIRRNRVSTVIPSSAIKTTGDYVAIFDVNLADMGKQEHPVPFKITKSPLGKKRINAD